MSKRWSLLVLAGMLSIAAVHAADKAATKEKYVIDGKEVHLARYSKAFLGAGNIRVEVAPYKTEDGDDGAILLFHGIESDWDGKAINHRVDKGSYNGQDFVAQYNGKDWTTIVMQNPYGTPQWELHVPGVKGGISLVPSDGAAQLTNPRAIFQEYWDQQKTETK